MRCVLYARACYARVWICFVIILSLSSFLLFFFFLPLPACCTFLHPPARAQPHNRARRHRRCKVSADRDDAKFQAESQKLQLSQLTREVDGLKMERDGIKQELAAAEKARDEAEKQANALSAYASGR